MNLKNLKDIYRLFLKYPAITTDSRNCPENSLFFALKGVSFNGNHFAKEAIKRGCKYAFVDEEKFADNRNIFYVADSLKTLQQLAKKHRKTLKTIVIGITGTNGKTTTKELIASVLKQKCRILYTQGNLNNHIGVPLTLLQLKKKDKIAVIEMGANHGGEIRELAEIAMPDYGLITNIGKAHLEGFGSFEGVIKAKGELYDYIRENQKKIFINHADGILGAISEGIMKITYGTDKACCTKGKIRESEPFLSVEWNRKVIRTNLIGSYNFENVLAAIAVGRYFDVPARRIVKALESYMPENDRSQYKETEKNKIIIDAYNANPTSMEASLSNFLQLSFPNKAVILGDMKELGEQSDKEHEKIVKILASEPSLSKVFLIGNCFKQTNSVFNTYADVDEFLRWLQKNPVQDMMILIKGSNSMNLKKVVDYL